MLCYTKPNSNLNLTPDLLSVIYIIHIYIYKNITDKYTPTFKSIKLESGVLDWVPVIRTSA